METEVLSKQKRIAPGSVIAIMAAALALLMIGSFLIGRYSIPLRQLMGIIVSNIIPAPLKEFFAVPQVWTERQEIVFLNIRLPRVLLSCMVGCCLATAGVSYQGVFQNPMAAPDILGASSGAAFGAALAILNGLSGYQITICAFASSLLSVAIVFLISGKTVGNKVLVLVLSGIMISSLFQAGTSFIKLVADPNNQLPAITYWLMGSLSGTQTREVNFAFWPMLIGIVPLVLTRWRINVLTMGDEEARTMGVNAGRLRLIVIVSATLITAASVSVSGMIGWVGLVIPHFARKLVGGNYLYLTPASMLLGAIFLLVVDNISRNLLAVEIPLGILTAITGAPFFIFLILKSNKE